MTTTPAATPTTTRCRERGTLTLQYALAVPLILLMVAVVWQLAVLAHTHNTLLAAAQDGARAAAVLGGSPHTGQDRAHAVLGAGLGAAAEQATIHIARVPSGTQVTITLPVTARLPWPAGWNLRVRATRHTEPLLVG